MPCLQETFSVCVCCNTCTLHTNRSVFSLTTMELQNFLYGRCLVQCASNPSHQSESRRLKENSPKGLEDSL